MDILERTLEITDANEGYSFVVTGICIDGFKCCACPFWDVKGYDTVMIIQAAIAAICEELGRGEVQISVMRIAD